MLAPNGSPYPSLCYGRALGTPRLERGGFVRFWVLPCLAPIPECGTFVPHVRQRSPHAFPLKNNKFLAKNRAASPQPFMFQYPCLSHMIHIHFMRAAPIRVENSEIARTLVK